jgi:hypothetical protein
MLAIGPVLGYVGKPQALFISNWHDGGISADGSMHAVSPSKLFVCLVRVAW